MSSLTAGWLIAAVSSDSPPTQSTRAHDRAPFSELKEISDIYFLAIELGSKAEAVSDRNDDKEGVESLSEDIQFQYTTEAEIYYHVAGEPTANRPEQLVGTIETLVGLTERKKDHYTIEIAISLLLPNGVGKTVKMIVDLMPKGVQYLDDKFIENLAMRFASAAENLVTPYLPKNDVLAEQAFFVFSYDYSRHRFKNLSELTEELIRNYPSAREAILSKASGNMNAPIKATSQGKSDGFQEGLVVITTWTGDDILERPIYRAKYKWASDPIGEMATVVILTGRVDIVLQDDGGYGILSDAKIQLSESEMWWQQSRIPMGEDIVDKSFWANWYDETLDPLLEKFTIDYQSILTEEIRYEIAENLADKTLAQQEKYYNYFNQAKRTLAEWESPKELGSENA